MVNNYHLLELNVHLTVWPGATAADLWRWLMLAVGALLIAHGILSKNVRIKDSRTWEGFWRGKIATKWWETLWMRTIFVGIGLAAIEFALTFDR